MNLPELDWRTLLLAGAALALVVGGIVLWWRRRPRDPEEVERRRRSYLNQVGRIVEGEVLEITERQAAEVRPPRSLRWRRAPAPVAKSGNGKRTLVLYSYSISGVTYQTAQDITGMEARACLDRVMHGQPVSVKYDPANPGNSILIADDWSGLH